MPQPTRIEILSRSIPYKGFFQLQKLELQYELFKGGMSKTVPREIFERGDSAGVLLYNRDSSKIILVKQFRAPAMDISRNGAWMIETIAGIVRTGEGETPVQSIMRETKEETGYVITDPEPITVFFSSPGGTSERIFLYYAEVGDADRRGTGGGNVKEDEDIDVVEVHRNQFFRSLYKGEYEDPKLIIAGYWLRARLEMQRVLKMERYEAIDLFAEPSQRDLIPLHPETVKYRIANFPELIIGYKTGDMREVKDADIWVNSESTVMEMDRFSGSSISSIVRSLGAKRDDLGRIVEDTIGRALREGLRDRDHVQLATVIETTSGALRRSNNVHRLLHVAAVQGRVPGQYSTDERVLEDCIRSVLTRANRPSLLGLFGSRGRSILIPLLGTGQGGGDVSRIAPRLIGTAVQFFKENPYPELREIYFLAYSERDRDACEAALARHLELGDLALDL
jgi:ADP-ribose pyrophosphatase